MLWVYFDTHWHLHSELTQASSESSPTLLIVGVFKGCLKIFVISLKRKQTNAGLFVRSKKILKILK